MPGRMTAVLELYDAFCDPRVRIFCRKIFATSFDSQCLFPSETITGDSHDKQGHNEAVMSRGQVKSCSDDHIDSHSAS